MCLRAWSLPRLLETYFLATPLFVLVDVYLSAPVRVAALEGSGLRWPYYGLLLVCGAICHWRPAWAPAVGMTESAANLLLLMLGILLPVWDAGARIEAGAWPAGPFDEVGLANFVVSGSVLLFTFYRSQHALFGGR